MLYISRDELLAYMEKIAPSSYAEHWDNCGMQVDLGALSYKKILIALDASTVVIDEAIALNCDLIISHHPLQMQGDKNLIYNQNKGSAIIKLVQNGISLFSAHTCFDSCKEGTNATLCNLLGLDNVRGIMPFEGETQSGCLWMGEADCTMEQLCNSVKKALDIEHIRYAGDINKRIKNIALCSGSGMSLYQKAIEAQADVFITGDLKYHDALDSLDTNTAIIDAGHFETEKPAMKSLINCLQSRFGGVQYNSSVIMASKAEQAVIKTI